MIEEAIFKSLNKSYGLKAIFSEILSPFYDNQDSALDLVKNFLKFCKHDEEKIEMMEDGFHEEVFKLLTVG